jgi:hypothetical protein
MLFIRQRLLLTLLNTLGQRVSNTDFQKLLFLYTTEYEARPSYEFVPYRFGAFSFVSYADKRRLIKDSLIVDDEQHWRLTEAGHAAARRQPIDEETIAHFCNLYAGLRGDALIAEVYRRYPYYATRSEIVDRVLPDPSVRAIVDTARPAQLGSGLLTIGYEGKSLEKYLNQLLRASVTLLCDVRRNPISRKYGFSKGTLSNACEVLGILYKHLPELGIASSSRRNLETQADYEALFAVYERDHLSYQDTALKKIRGWIEREGHRVALTCFEEKSSMCHRYSVAKALESMENSILVTWHL